MATLTYETLKFRQTAHGVEVTLLNLAKTLIPTEDMERMGLVKVEKHSLEFNNNKVDLRFAQLLEKYFGSLKNNLTGNKVTYIHRNSEIPLLGNVAFGIVHRGSSIIEIKPVTSCNLDCVYCSISEGLSSKKNDFIVEEEYMIQEVEKVLEEVNESVEIHVGVQGEPFLYADMDLLLSDLNKMELVHTISIDTNGTFLTMER